MPNRLANEKSPYLLQHAENPVDWYPWGNDAFEKAKAEGKPIFLSVGYSTCHWCHVMERESFENPSIAETLNKYFVCIKVDREERPDIDRIYMTALQATGQNGGWPMSMFLRPDLKPFYGGTYFPPEPRSGRAGFPQVLLRIHQIWETERDKVDDSAERIMAFLRDIAQSSPGDRTLLSEQLDRCFDQFQSMFDATHGGFGSGPKFPRPVVLNFLTRYFARTGNREALAMVTRTLQAMAAGGIYDHVGGGFHRYAVDVAWRVPHFEKMLYDQAQLVRAYTDAFLITGEGLYRSVAEDVLDYVNRDLKAPEGAFFSAEDADSPKSELPTELGEGAFYVFTKAEVIGVLGKKDGETVASYYGLTDEGNAPFDPQGEFGKYNILYVARSVDRVSAESGLPRKDVVELLAKARDLLMAHRLTRPRPRLDDKVLTSWNGLMISAYALAFQSFGTAVYLKIAERAARFILSRLIHPETRTLQRRFRDGEPNIDGKLDDYAFFIQALLDLYESSFDALYLERAIELTETQIRLFWDETNGGFFDTAEGDPSILVRLKDHYDGAEPAGNSICAMNLLRLAQMTDQQALQEKAEKIISLAAPILEAQPTVMPQMAAALDFNIGKPVQIFIVGRRIDPATARLVQVVRTTYAPNRIIVLVDPDEPVERLASVIPFVRSLNMKDGKSTAYVCTDYVCRLPTNDPSELSMLITERDGSAG